MEERLYTRGVSVLSRGEGRTLYQIDGGHGQIIDYALYPGISMQFNEIRCEYLEMEGASLPFVEMNYCVSGRYECEFWQGCSARMQEGVFSACRGCLKKKSSSFPTSYYRGISLMLNVGVAQRFMDEHCPELSLRLDDIPRRLCPDNTCFLARAEGTLRQAFEQIEQAPPWLGLPYFRVKVLELLTLLCAWSPGAAARNGYLTQERTGLMQHIRAHLQQELHRKMTLDELARAHGISVTALKRDFAALYGISPAAYRRQYRMSLAAQMLAQTDWPVMQIAVRVGYLNASKFSSAFRSEMGETPRAYRKKAGLFGAWTAREDGLE